ncbi:MAG: hypothetical protein A4S12_10940 [Proteobacteria bacterium SG_bin5]|nr:type II toxin-antitoxin system RelE/ParE family toxin [Sphingomonas sp.]OQW39934.1 MAG: hypothetical protein A4S12_10940 [Proteobacteria bacterium SG_bin5]
MSGTTAREVTYTKAAVKALARMPANNARLIRDKIDLFARDPASLANNVAALKGSDLARLRVSDWRVIIDADRLTVLVVAIGARGGIYA